MRALTSLAALAAIGMVPSGTVLGQLAASSLTLFFDWGKPDVRADDQAVLDQAAAAWRASPGARLMLSGHTDRSGNAAYNLRASRKRAETVRDELIRRGVPAGAIETVGFGEGRPLVPTEDGVREVQNRRVEIELKTAG